MKAAGVRLLAMWMGPYVMHLAQQLPSLSWVGDMTSCNQRWECIVAWTSSWGHLTSHSTGVNELGQPVRRAGIRAAKSQDHPGFQVPPATGSSERQSH